jgi:hypothetical protein
MTTIAFDGRYLAADTLGTRSGTPSNRESRKITVAAGFAYAVNGDWGPVVPDLIKWHQDGANPADIPTHGAGSLMVAELSSRRCWIVSGPQMPYLDEEAAPFTGGSGGDIALGAIDAGVNAMEAVRIASKRDISTGGPIDFVDLEWPDKGVQRWDGHMPSSKLPMPVRDTGGMPIRFEDPTARIETDENGEPRIVAHETAHIPQVQRAGVIGKADICSHGYVRVTCSRCIHEVAAAVARVGNAKANGHA